VQFHLSLCRRFIFENAHGALVVINVLGRLQIVLGLELVLLPIRLSLARQIKRPLDLSVASQRLPLIFVHREPGRLAGVCARILSRVNTGLTVLTVSAAAVHRRVTSVLEMQISYLWQLNRPLLRLILLSFKRLSGLLSFLLVAKDKFVFDVFIDPV